MSQAITPMMMLLLYLMMVIIYPCSLLMKYRANYSFLSLEAGIPSYVLKKKNVAKIYELTNFLEQKNHDTYIKNYKILISSIEMAPQVTSH